MAHHDHHDDGPPPPSRHDRVLGALLGVHAGDCLGATFEFQSWNRIRKGFPDGLDEIIGGGPFRWAPGEPTDDTDMTRAVLLGYRDSFARRTEQRRRWEEEPQQQEGTSRQGGTGADANRANDDSDLYTAAGKHMLDWLHGRWPNRTPGSGPVDIGRATRLGLLELDGRGGAVDPAHPTGAGPGHRGNGSLMRCIPTALFADSIEAVVRHSAALSAVTHDDPVCVVACAAYNAIAWHLLRGASPESAVEEGLGLAARLERRYDQQQLLGPDERASRSIAKGATVLSVAVLAESGPGPALPGEAQGYVLESLALAVAAVLDARPLRRVLADVVRIGRDTDTNAAIAGGLLGVRDGAGAVPASWREKLWFAREFEGIVAEMLATENGWNI